MPRSFPEVQRLEREVDRLPIRRVKECVELYEHRILQLVLQYAIRNVQEHQRDNPARSKCCRDRDYIRAARIFNKSRATAKF